MKMEIEAKIKQLVNIMYCVIDVDVRYVGDSADDDMPTNFPLLNKSQWKATVEVDTGKIIGWPEGEERHMHIKVCDAGIYTLLDSNLKELSKIDGYVPRIVPNEYGDYIVMDIDKNGYIKQWNKKPDVSAFFEDDN